jgi:hypothetical protein
MKGRRKECAGELKQQPNHANTINKKEIDWSLASIAWISELIT